MVRIKRLNPTKAQKETVLNRQKNLCNKCGKLLVSATSPPAYDHIIALGLGGKDITENMEALCPDCHAVKTKEDMAKMTDLKRLSPKQPAVEINPSRYQDRLGFKVTPHKGLNLPRVWVNNKDYQLLDMSSTFNTDKDFIYADKDYEFYPHQVFLSLMSTPWWVKVEVKDIFDRSNKTVFVAEVKIGTQDSKLCLERAVGNFMPVKLEFRSKEVSVTKEYKFAIEVEPLQITHNTPISPTVVKVALAS